MRVFVVPSVNRGALVRLAACVLCALSAVAAQAQSGRRQPAPRNPVPAATPTPDPGVYSESRTRPADDPNAPLHNFYVVEDENHDSFTSIPMAARDIILQSFVERLRVSRVVSASSGGKSDRARAREHAKTEKLAYTVLLEVAEEQITTRRPRTAHDPVPLENMVVRYYVYTPQTATLRVQGQVFMRPGQASARVGGVRVPIPAPRTSSRIGVEYVLEQAGRDAAERMAAQLDITLPER